MSGRRGSGRASCQTNGSEGEVLRSIRSLRVCVFHPNDPDREELTRQLHRIGCQAQAFWPPPSMPPPETNLVFVAVYPDLPKQGYGWCRDKDAPPVIAVVNYESPTTIGQVMRLGARGVITVPVRSFGLLSAMVLALETVSELKELRNRVVRLEEKLKGARTISAAQDILCVLRGFTREEGYKLMREQAMSKRITVEEIASAIVRADEIISRK